MKLFSLASIFCAAAEPAEALEQSEPEEQQSPEAQFADMDLNALFDWMIQRYPEERIQAAIRNLQSITSLVEFVPGFKERMWSNPVKTKGTVMKAVSDLHNELSGEGYFIYDEDEYQLFRAAMLRLKELAEAEADSAVLSYEPSQYKVQYEEGQPDIPIDPALMQSMRAVRAMKRMLLLRKLARTGSIWQ